MEELWKARGKLCSPFFLSVNASGMVWAGDRW